MKKVKIKTSRLYTDTTKYVAHRLMGLMLYNVKEFMYNPDGDGVDNDLRLMIF